MPFHTGKIYINELYIYISGTKVHIVCEGKVTKKANTKISNIK